MAITRLKRKGRKNKLKVRLRAQKMKLENFAPVLKNVDVEAIKEEFKLASKTKSKPKTEAVKAEKAETKSTVAVATPKIKLSTDSEVKADKKATAPKKKAATKANKEEKPVAEKKAPATKTKKKTTVKAKKKD